MTKCLKSTGLILFGAVCITGFSAAVAMAGGASHWTDNNEAAFKKGTMHNVVATNLGDLKLSRAVKTILEEDAQVTTVNALAEDADGNVYAGTGPEGILLRIKGGKVTTVAMLRDNTTITALLFDSMGRLLVATAGDHGRVLRFDHPAQLTEMSRKPANGNDGGNDASNDASTQAAVASIKPVEVFSADGVQYVWALQQTPDGKLYAATGPNGQLFEIDPDGHSSVLFKSDENNLLSLLSDGKDLLYAGTDPDGLIYRINRKTKDIFVLFNAPESEVDCLALDARGNLYAGTGEALPGEDAKAAEQAEAGEKDQTGRPESSVGGPLPGTPPENPKPPAIPNPNPGEPNPIPKSNSPKAATTRAAAQAPRLAHTIDQTIAFDRWGINDGANGGVTRLALLMDDPGDPGGGEPAPPSNPPDNPSPPGMPHAPGQNNQKTHGPTSGPAAPVSPDVDTGRPHADSNAIYRIAPDGFVKEIFRRPVMVLSMIEDNGALLVGTGGDGIIYQVKPAAEETVALAKVDPHDISSLVRLRDGSVMLGFSDVGGIASLSSGFAAEGTFTSPVLDATQISLFGKIHLDGSLPPGTSLAVATRSGNVQDANKEGWSKWSDDIAAAQYVQTPSPSARFLQYRLTMKSADAKDSPVVDEVDIAYQMPNLAPVVKGIKIAAKGEADSGGAGAPPAPEGNAAHPPDSRYQVIVWDAEDPNGDSLQYSLFLRMGSDGPWVLLKDKLTDPHFEWDTRAVADGRYYVKVVASDAASNPVGQGLTGSRVSDLLIVDNTPPVIGDLKTDVKGRTAHVEAHVVDHTSIVANCEYTVDSNTDWQVIEPSGKIYDSPEATVSFALENLTPGKHQVTLRATDSKGNQSFATVLLTVETPSTLPMRPN